MLPHKLPKGAAALKRVQIFEGVPAAYTRSKKVVVPSALKVLRLKPGRKVTVLGRLSKEVGWKHGETVKELEAKRREKGLLYFQRKKALQAIVDKVKKEVAPKIAKETAALEELGFTA
jgi:large subunit ribosomal protein L13Ae